MVTLRPGATALTLLNTSKLLQLAVEALHIPSHIVQATNVCCGKMWCRIIRVQPINVTVCGNELEDKDQALAF